MGLKDIIAGYTRDRLKTAFQNMPEVFLDEVEEIRIRADKPLLIRHRGREYALTDTGEPHKDISLAIKPTRQDVLKIVELISDYSLYAFEDELKNGYITIPGGHRVGITGRVVPGADGIRTIKHISGLNIRISHEITGCADGIMRFIFCNGEAQNTMIISPPGNGKTTMLRDLVRQLSDGAPGRFPGHTVGLVDERSEIAGCYMGIPQKDVGDRTDVLDGCRKNEGMLMLLRSMSPQIIAVDEIGKFEDVSAIEDILNAGVKIICTLHGADLEDAAKKPALAGIFDAKAFKRFVVLKGRGVVGGVYDQFMTDLTKGVRCDDG